MIVILDVIMREKVTKMYNYIIYTELKSSRLHTHVHFTSNSIMFIQCRFVYIGKLEKATCKLLPKPTILV